MSQPGFDGATVVVFESRMAEAMAKSVASHGGLALTAPSMREVPLTDNPHAFEFARKLLAHELDVVVFMTGVGTRILFEALAMRLDLPQVLAALGSCTVVARGPKPLVVLREYRVPVTLTIPEPNTWREIVQALDESDRGVELDGKTVAIQEYGASNERLIQAITARGATVLPVPVYRWALPTDLAPLLRGIREITEDRAHVAMFTNAAQVRHVLQVAAQNGLEAPLRKAMRRVVVASIGPTTTEALVAEGLPVDLEPSHPKMGVLIDEAAKASAELLRRKREASPVSVTAPAAGQVVDRRESLFLKACRREPTSATPIWLMRQAGRYMKSYRDLRNKVSFLELCKRPELAAEVTVSAAAALGVDAAILFSDILLIVEPLGLGLEYTPEDGPVIAGQIEGRRDVEHLREIEPAESLAFVFEAVRQSRAALPSSLPLIGFSGAPFTLAAYVLEGGASKTFLHTKRLMYADPGAWHALMEKISRGIIKYLNGQIRAGVDAVQLFDSWVGCLGPCEYREFVLPHSRAIIQALAPGVPVLHFGTGTAAFLPEMREAGGDVIGVDFRVELDRAWDAIGHDRGIQGNLDPVVLCTTPEVIRTQARRILEQAAGRPGHVFNLGHGVLPATPVDHVTALIEMVHELSRR